MIGEKDIQVDWQSDGSIFETLAKTQKNLEVAFVENANHVLKYEPRPREELNGAEASANYNTATAHLDEQAVEKFIAWLKVH